MSGGLRIGRDNETLIQGARTGYNTQFQEIPPLALDVAGDVTDNTTGTPDVELVAIGDTSAGNEGPAINNNFATVLAFVKEIKGLLSRDKQMECVGLNVDQATLIWSPKGGMQATTFSDINSQVILRPTPLRRAAQEWVPDEESRWSGALKTEDTVATLRFAFGLRDGAASAPDTGAGDLVPGADDYEAMFYFNTGENDGEIVVVMNTDGEAQDLRSTGIVPEANTLYRFHVEFDADRRPRFFMSINDGDEFRVGENTIVDGIPEPLGAFEPMGAGAPLIPVHGIETLAALPTTQTFVGVSVGILNPGANP